MQRASDAPIRTSTEDLACAQAAAHLGNWRWEMQGDRVTWSAELFRIFGVDKGTFVPTNDAANARIHPDDRARHRDVVGVALPGQTVPPFEMRIVRLDGEGSGRAHRLRTNGGRRASARGGLPEHLTKPAALEELRRVFEDLG